jgi:hypothetical protein
MPGTDAGLLIKAVVADDAAVISGPRALSDDLISSYYVESCMRDHIIRYFPPDPR